MVKIINDALRWLGLILILPYVGVIMRGSTKVNRRILGKVTSRSSSSESGRASCSSLEREAKSLLAVNTTGEELMLLLVGGVTLTATRSFISIYIYIYIYMYV